MITDAPASSTVLTDHQVLQRDAATGHAAVALGAAATAVDAIGHIVASTDADGTLTLPAGGPYLIRTDSGETIARRVLVGDIWMLAGQSNMQGSARLVDLEPPSDVVNLLDMARTWRQATEPLHQLSQSPDPVHSGATEEERAAYRVFDTLGFGAGLGLAFARAYADATGVPVGLVATAHGGTSLAQWSPALRDQGGMSLYGSWRESLAAAGGRVAGILWYQGESDTEPSADFSFEEDLAGLVAAMRADAGDPALAFVHVQLGRYVADAPAANHRRWAAVREAQRRFDATAMATAVDLPLDDIIHVNTAGLRRLGRRLAALAARSATPLQLDGIDVDPDGVGLTVRYRGVNGRLLGGSHIPGFSLHDARGAATAVIYHAEVSASGDAVHLRLGRPVQAGDHLAYAYGLDPQVSLHDSADQAAPAFGPLRLTPPG